MTTKNRFSGKLPGAGGGNFFKSTGKSKFVIRLMPIPEGEEGEAFRKVGKHWMGGKSYICPEVTHAKPCVACAFRRMMPDLMESMSSDKKRKEMETVADILRPRLSYWLRIIDRSAVGDGVQIYEAPYSVYQVIHDELHNVGNDISDIKTGSDLIISKTGTGKQTNYNSHFSEIESRLAKKTERETLMKQWDDLNWESYWNVSSEMVDLVKGLTAEFKVAWNEILEVAGLDPEPDKKSKKKKKSRAVEEDEDDEEEEEAEDDEEDEDDEEEEEEAEDDKEEEAEEEEEEAEEEDDDEDDEDDAEDDEDDEEEEAEEEEDDEWDDEEDEKPKKPAKKAAVKKPAKRAAGKSLGANKGKTSKTSKSKANPTTNVKARESGASKVKKAKASLKRKTK